MEIKVGTDIIEVERIKDGIENLFISVDEKLFTFSNILLLILASKPLTTIDAKSCAKIIEEKYIKKDKDVK